MAHKLEISVEATSKPILKITSGYDIERLPKGLEAVLTKQTTGFWGKLGSSPAKPEFSDKDIPSLLYTFDPWVGCLWGKSCKFCYVPSIGTRLYPGGRNSYWYKEWGHWLLPKSGITCKLRRQLLDEAGRTRFPYRGAAIYMAPKTDPFLPVPDYLETTRQNLDVFMEADIFLMCQTRSPKVVDDPEIFNRVVEMAKEKKVGVSFSISSDLLEQQRQIELGGLLPEERLHKMSRLKQAGVFVSAAVAPLMPYSPNFARRLVDSACHASIQALHSTGPGAATPNQVLQSVESGIPNYRKLEVKLADEIESLNQSGSFAWGIANKGFIGAFIAARRFYEKI